MKLPCDLSGSRSKNRFRNEMLWGLEKIYNIYESENDFVMVFDYVCDIELHLNESMEFYQIKTSSKGSPYSIKKISGPDAQGNSILGKVYVLKNIIDNEEGDLKSKIAIVVNTPLKTADKKIKSSVKEFELVNLDEKSMELVNENLKKELNIEEDIDLNSSYYIFTSMDLFEPSNSLIGQTVNFFMKITGEEPKKVVTLYRALSDTIAVKANYELQCNDYSEVISKKGITKSEFNTIIKKYINVADESTKKAKTKINEIYDGFRDNTKMNIALGKIVKELTINKQLKKIEEMIAQYINEHLEELDKTFEETTEILIEIFSNEFTLEYTTDDKKALVILVLVRYGEGVYE
jgi:hypothetical protein